MQKSESDWAFYAKNLVAVQERVIYMLEHYTTVLDVVEREALTALRYQVDKRIKDLVCDGH